MSLSTVTIELVSAEGQSLGPPLDVPAGATKAELELLTNELLQNEDRMPYAFYVGDIEIDAALVDTVKQHGLSTEAALRVTYVPQAVFRVRPVTRCAGSLQGHSEAVLCCAFSPDSKRLASGSGDCTVRLWNTGTQFVDSTCTGHTGWVLCLAWSPDGTKVASGGYDGSVRVWDAATGKQIARFMGHTKWITGLTWEPFHLNPRCVRLASSSKDATVRVWDLSHGRMTLCISGHNAPISCVRWGGSGLIYTASYDRTVKVWDNETGKLVRSLDGHAHRVNTLALSTEYVLRCGAFTYKSHEIGSDTETAHSEAVERYKQVAGSGERLVSGSDDFTMFLWSPSTDKRSIARLLGHQQLVNHVAFSPDGRTVASASFDCSVRLWDGLTGRFLAVLRGHVQSVYQLAWSGDGRMLVTGSKDSTMKVWDAKTKTRKFDLPGHADEVYAVDWSVDGQMVVSGSKDHLLKLWRN